MRSNTPIPRPSLIVITLGTGFADPDMEAMRQKLNEMILNGRR